MVPKNVFFMSVLIWKKNNSYNEVFMILFLPLQLHS